MSNSFFILVEKYLQAKQMMEKINFLFSFNYFLHPLVKTILERERVGVRGLKKFSFHPLSFSQEEETFSHHDDNKHPERVRKQNHFEGFIEKSNKIVLFGGGGECGKWSLLKKFYYGCEILSKMKFYLQKQILMMKPQNLFKMKICEESILNFPLQHSSLQSKSQTSCAALDNHFNIYHVKIFAHFYVFTTYFILSHTIPATLKSDEMWFE